MSDNLKDIPDSIGGGSSGPPANHPPQTDVPRASVPSPKTKDNHGSLLDQSSAAQRDSPQLISTQSLTPTYSEHEQVPLDPTNMQGTFPGTLSHGGSQPGSPNVEVPQSSPLRGQFSHGTFPATNPFDNRDGQTLSTHAPGRGRPPPGFSSPGRGPPPQGLSGPGRGPPLPGFSSPGRGPPPQGLSGPGRGLPPQVHGQVDGSRPPSALRRIRGGQGPRHPTHPPNVPFIKAKGRGGGISKGGYPLPGNKAFGALPKGAGVKMPEGMSERAVQQWKRLHTLHQQGHSLDKEEQDVRTGTNVTAVEIQTARKGLERKNAELSTKEDVSKILSDCVTLLDVDVIGELRARVEIIENPAARSIAPAPEGLDSFTEEPIGDGADVFYEGGDDGSVLYTTEGYPYYYDDSGVAQWYDPEMAEYRGEEIEEHETHFEQQQPYAGEIMEEEML